MMEARYQEEGFWKWRCRCLTELAWLSPRRFADLLARLADGSLDKLHRTFDAQ